MNKFGLISTVLATIAIWGAQPAASRTNPPAAKEYVIGLQLYTVRDDCAKDFPGTLAAVAKIGFAGVEFAGYYGRSAKELRQMLDDDHLKCLGSHVSLNDLLGDNFEKTVAFNHELGNNLLVVPSIPGDRHNTRAALLDTCKLFNELAKKLEKEGIQLAYHNHEEEFTPKDGEMPWYTLFGNTDNRVAIQFDIGNALQGGVQAMPFLTKYPNRIVSVHVKDFSSTNHQALLGEGDENWKEVIPFLKKNSRHIRFIIEQETYPFPPLLCAEKCLHNYQEMLAKK